MFIGDIQVKSLAVLIELFNFSVLSIITIFNFGLPGRYACGPRLSSLSFSFRLVRVLSLHIHFDSNFKYSMIKAL